jgi:hypothetical protein
LQAVYRVFRAPKRGDGAQIGTYPYSAREYL